MSSKLKQAIAATRAGQSKEAQMLLTQVLNEDPNHAQAWYLLSLLVDDDSKKQAYLQKVLDLDPAHEKAQQQLTQFAVPETPAETAVTQPEPEPISQTETEDIPDWLSEMRPANTAETADAEPDKVTPTPDEDIPDWLKSTASGDWSQAEQPTLVSEPQTSALPEQSEAQPDDDIRSSLTDEFEREADSDSPQTKQTTPSEQVPDAQEITSQQASPPSNLDRILTILIIGALIIFALLLYFIFLA